MNLVFQLFVPSYQAFCHLDTFELLENVHLLLQLFDELRVAAPDIQLGYSVVLSLLVPLLLREVTDTPGACSLPSSRSVKADQSNSNGNVNLPFPFPLEGLGCGDMFGFLCVKAAPFGQ
jgi:hypothetical protein